MISFRRFFFSGHRSFWRVQVKDLGTFQEDPMSIIPLLKVMISGILSVSWQGIPWYYTCPKTDCLKQLRPRSTMQPTSQGLGCWGLLCYLLGFERHLGRARSSTSDLVGRLDESHHLGREPVVSGILFSWLVPLGCLRWTNWRFGGKELSSGLAKNPLSSTEGMAWRCLNIFCFFLSHDMIFILEHSRSTKKQPPQQEKQQAIATRIATSDSNTPRTKPGVSSLGNPDLMCDWRNHLFFLSVSLTPFVIADVAFPYVVGSAPGTWLRSIFWHVQEYSGVAGPVIIWHFLLLYLLLPTRVVSQHDDKWYGHMELKISS